jgi:DNA-directed RNA polymerase subunit beta'
MTISFLPVLPPDLRPIIRLQNNIIVTSELNFLYAKIINSNNKIIQFKNMNVDEKFIKKETRIIQETIDLLINNSKNKKNVWE